MIHHPYYFYRIASIFDAPRSVSIWILCYSLPCTQCTAVRLSRRRRTRNLLYMQDHMVVVACCFTTQSESNRQLVWQPRSVYGWSTLGTVAALIDNLTSLMSFDSFVIVNRPESYTCFQNLQRRQQSELHRSLPSMRHRVPKLFVL